MARYPGVSASVTRRLPRYYRYLGELKDRGIERISSREFADMTGLTASQIRQDLNCFGGFGQQGYGYNIPLLYTEIGKILSVEQELPAILVGVGNLGRALLNNPGFERCGFRVIGAFDKNPNAIGKQMRHVQIYSADDLENFCKEHKPVMAILCIPYANVGGVVEKLVESGVKGFWNFSNYDLAIQYRDKVVVENVHLMDSMMTLSFNMREYLDQEEGKTE